MCKFIGKSNEWILCKLSKSDILRLYSIVHVAMETKKTSHFTCQSKSFISIFFTSQVSACELQSCSCHDLAINLVNQCNKKRKKFQRRKKSQNLVKTFNATLVLGLIVIDGFHVTSSKFKQTNHQPRPQGFSLKKCVGREKVLASAGHVSPRTP